MDFLTITEDATSTELTRIVHFKINQYRRIEHMTSKPNFATAWDIAEKDSREMALSYIEIGDSKKLSQWIAARCPEITMDWLRTQARVNYIPNWSRKTRQTLILELQDLGILNDEEQFTGVTK